MRPLIRQFVRIATQTMPIAAPVYEFGSFQVKGQENLANLRGLFPGMEYVGCDLRPGPGVDCVLDVAALDLPSECAGTVLCLDTLEHVEYCREAVAEMHRVVRVGGVCLLSSVFVFPVHKHPHDYWRFTPEGLKSLLMPFESSFVTFVGDPHLPRTVIGLGCKGPQDWSGFEATWKARP